MTLFSNSKITAIFVTAALFVSAPLCAEMVSIPASSDATLYEDFGTEELPDIPQGITANGSGDYLFAGRTSSRNDYKLRRAIIKFDVSSALPQGATITSARLELFMNRSNLAGETDVSIHVAEKNWGEGPSDADGQEGIGADALTGDATWVYTFFDTMSWDTLGGDFVAQPSATTNVGFDTGVFTWESAQMTVDVQNWLDNPTLNFGWFLIGDESDPFTATAKRYDSRSLAASSNPPTLKVTYTNSSDGSDLWIMY